MFIAIRSHDQRCGCQIIADVMEIDGVAGPRAFARAELFLKSIHDPGRAVAQSMNPRLGGGIAHRLYDGQHASIHLGDDRFDRPLRSIMFDCAHRSGVGQGLCAHAAGRQLDAIVFARLFRRADKRFLSPEICQNSLQGQRIALLFYLRTLAKRPDLRSASSVAQTLFAHADIAVSRMPAQEFFFR